jgi:hypothetical protein
MAISFHSHCFLKKFFLTDGSAPLVTKELVLRLMFEIGQLGFSSYSVSVEQRVGIVAILTIPGPWLVLLIRTTFCHCWMLKKKKGGPLAHAQSGTSPVMLYSGF